jgi:hypothetical protein
LHDSIPSDQFGFQLPIPAILAILAISFASLCLRTSARTPPPIEPLLKTKTKPQFERPVESLSTPFFLLFDLPIKGQFSAFFLVSGVRSAEGRSGLAVSPFGCFLSADSDCYFFKDLAHIGAAIL